MQLIYSVVIMEDTSFQTRMRIQNPSLLQLYSFPTPNGVKVAAALEEIIELRSKKGSINLSNLVNEEEKVVLYEPHAVNIRAGENRLKWYGDMGFPNQKIPCLLECGAENSTISLFESGSILTYLAEKYDELLPKNKCLHVQTMNWLFYGSTSVSTQFKLFGFYYKYCSHGIPYCVDRYTKEVHRLLGQMECQLAKHGRHWFVGDAFTIADISMWPWVHALFCTYDNAGEFVFNISVLYPNVFAWYTRCMARPASKRALDVCNMNFDTDSHM